MVAMRTLYRALSTPSRIPIRGPHLPDLAADTGTSLSPRPLLPIPPTTVLHPPPLLPAQRHPTNQHPGYPTNTPCLYDLHTIPTP
ncbi:hypothetical protein AAHC03_021090 [Spirometra sp. Aus1]